MTIRVHLVAHTHWDREWYHTAARFQYRLARLLDELLDLLRRRPDFPTFLLDGQAVVLDDYLAVCPHRSGELSALLGAGRLETGPWLVLPDEFLVSAEALVRNLLAGAATARRHGGTPMRVGYSPDAFGHTGALPLLVAGFGIEVAVVWRGFGGEPGQEGDLHRWRSADGSEVVMVHLPRGGYEYGASLPAGGPELARRWSALRELLERRARSPELLVMCGADHHAVQPDLPEIAERLQALSPDCEVRLSSLGSYVDAVAAWAASHRSELPVVSGELREGRRHAWALQGTLGSRLYLKQANAACQRLLERYAEPLAAHAGRLGRDLRAPLAWAWRQLLENHPHDSICGTSADPVHREMLIRFERCRAGAEELVAEALRATAGHDVERAREAGRAAWRAAVLLFNPSPRSRSGVAEVRVPLFRRDVRVGQAQPRIAVESARPGDIALRSPDGGLVAFQELERESGFELIESPRAYPDCDEVEWRTLAVRSPDLPPLGVAALAVEDAGASAQGGPQAGPGPVTVEAGALANEHVGVRVEADGTLELRDQVTGLTCRGLGALVDTGDAGDSYTFAAPRRDRRIEQPDAVAVAVLHGGPLRGTLEVVRRYSALDLTARTRVSLDAGSRLVRLHVEGENRQSDHRLRMAFPLGERLRRVVADGHFGPVERPAAGRRGSGRDLLERPVPTAPMQRYVAAAGARRALLVLADGLPEYEARPNGTVLVTLLRCFGQLSRADLSERPGHAGWPTPTPDAQCPGPFRARLGVQLIGPDALEQSGAIEPAAEEFHAPVLAQPLRSALAAPRPVPGPELVGDGLVFSAMKPSESGRGLVLRCYNALPRPVAGAWRLPWPVAAVERCRLDETPLRRVEVGSRGDVPFEAEPREVVTLLVR